MFCRNFQVIYIYNGVSGYFTEKSDIFPGCQYSLLSILNFLLHQDKHFKLRQQLLRLIKSNKSHKWATAFDSGFLTIAFSTNSDH